MIVEIKFTTVLNYNLKLFFFSFLLHVLETRSRDGNRQKWKMVYFFSAAAFSAFWEKLLKFMIHKQFELMLQIYLVKILQIWKIYFENLASIWQLYIL